jgi:hypothetical protein
MSMDSLYPYAFVGWSNVRGGVLFSHQATPTRLEPLPEIS